MTPPASPSKSWCSALLLVRFSHQLTVEAHHRPVITSLRLLTVLNVGFKNVGARHAVPQGAQRRAPCTDGPLTHFTSLPGEKCGLLHHLSTTFSQSRVTVDGDVGPLFDSTVGPMSTNGGNVSRIAQSNQHPRIIGGSVAAIRSRPSP